MRFFALFPLALAVSMAAHGQTLNEAMQSALEVHPEIQAGINARLSVEEQMKAAKDRLTQAQIALGDVGLGGGLLKAESAPEMHRL